MFSKIRSYIEICRVSNLPTIWTNVLAATVLTGPGDHWPIFFPIVISMSFYYSAGMGLNDILDAESDRTSRPQRPIPSGRIKIWEAWILVSILFSAALTLLLVAPNPHALPAGLVLLILIVWYDAFHKKNVHSILVMAGCRFMVFVVTALALSGGIKMIVLLAATIQFGYTICISAVARHENKRKEPFRIPFIPWMIAGISMLDGLLLTIWNSGGWFLIGLAGASLTIFGQKYVQGD